MTMIKTTSDGILLPRNKEELELSKPVSRTVKDGIPVVKGAVLTEEWLERKRDYYENLMNVFSAYPDLYLDKIQNPEMKTELFFYQRIILRAVMRYKDIYTTAPRALT